MRRVGLTDTRPDLVRTGGVATWGASGAVGGSSAVSIRCCVAAMSWGVFTGRGIGAGMCVSWVLITEGVDGSEECARSSLVSRCRMRARFLRR